MSEPSEPQRPISPSPANDLRRAAFWLVCATVTLAGAVVIVHLLVTARADPARWGVDVLVAAGVLLAAHAMTRRRWHRPTLELRELVARVRAGEAPIEELSTITGGMRGIVVPLVQELLRESRQQRCDLAALNQEIRQRVAHRTDALERTIGTLRQQATRDALTGLFNRRFLEQYLPQVVRRAVEGRTDLTVLMADLDCFKALNDTLGHAAGDDLLRSIGQIVRSTLRGEDVPFRLGGDEFLIVMPGSTAEQGRALGQRLSSLVDALGRTMKVPQQPRLSFGVACLTDVPERTVAGLSDAADKALYECKRQRRGTGAKGASAWRAGGAGGDGGGLQGSGSSLQCPAL